MQVISHLDSWLKILRTPSPLHCIIIQILSLVTSSPQQLLQISIHPTICHLSINHSSMFFFWDSDCRHYRHCLAVTLQTSVSFNRNASQFHYSHVAHNVWDSPINICEHTALRTPGTIKVKFKAVISSGITSGEPPFAEEATRRLFWG